MNLYDELVFGFVVFGLPEKPPFIVLAYKRIGLRILGGGGGGGDTECDELIVYGAKKQLASTVPQ